MATFLLTGVVLFGSFLANILLLQGLADLISLRLWQTVPQPALRRAAAEIDHVIAAIITAAVFGLLWRDHPVSAVVSSLVFYLLLLGGGVIRLLLLTHKQIQLIEDRQFNLRDGRLLLQEEELEGPLLCRLAEQKHPAAEGTPGGFSSTAVELYDPQQGRIARNIYYDRLKAARTLDQLNQAGVARTFDLALIGRNAAGDYLSLRLSSNWVPLLCGQLKELPPQVRDWWKNLLDCDYRQPQRVNDNSFSHYLRPLYLAAETDGLCNPDFIAEFHGLEQLISNSEAPLQLIAGKLLRSLIPGDLSPVSTDPDSALLCWRQLEEA